MSKSLDYNCPTIHQNNRRKFSLSNVSGFILLNQKFHTGRTLFPYKSTTNSISIKSARRYGAVSASLSELVVFQDLKILEAFSIPTTSYLSLAALGKRPTDPMVLFQTGAVMLCVYVLANFVMPAIMIKRMGLDKDEEVDKPDTDSGSSSVDSQNVQNSNSRPKSRGFNSTKPK